MTSSPSPEDRGLVERTPPPGRGHPSAVHASAAGRALLDEVTPPVLAAVTPDVLGLDPAAHHRLNLDLPTTLVALSP